MTKNYMPSLPITPNEMANPALLEWAENHPFHRRLLPYLSSRVSDSGSLLLLEPAVRQKIRRWRLDCSIQSMPMSAETSRLVEACDSCSIGVVPLKGADLAKRLYGGLDLRPFGDIDLFVEPGMIESACSLVQDMGYRYVGSNMLHYHREFSMLSKSGGFTFHLELHERLLGNAILGNHWAFGLMGSRGLSEVIWQRSCMVDGCRRLSPTDELFFLILHLSKHILAGRHDYAHGSSLSLLALDIHLAVDKWCDDINWNSLLRTAQNYRLTRPIALGLLFVDLWFGGMEKQNWGTLSDEVKSLPSELYSWAFQTEVAVEERNNGRPGNHGKANLVKDAWIMSNNHVDRLVVAPAFLAEFIRRKIWL